jgi:hypothetical protein
MSTRFKTAGIVLYARRLVSVTALVGWPTVWGKRRKGK